MDLFSEGKGADSTADLRFSAYAKTRWFSHDRVQMIASVREPKPVVLSSNVL